MLIWLMLSSDHRQLQLRSTSTELTALPAANTVDSQGIE